MMTFPAIDSGFIITWSLSSHGTHSIFSSRSVTVARYLNTLYSFLHHDRFNGGGNQRQYKAFGASLPVLICSRAVYFSPPSWCIFNPSVPSLHQKLPAGCGHSSKHHEPVDLFERCNAALHSTRRMSGDVFEANCDIFFSTRIEFDFVPMV